MKINFDNLKKIGNVTLFIIMFIFVIYYYYKSDKLKTENKILSLHNKEMKQTKYMSLRNSLELNNNNLLMWIMILDIKYPQIVLKQSIQECGWDYRSNRALKYNNLFGFQHSNDDVLKFKHWLESVFYYKKWQDKYYKGGDYYLFLDNYKYATDSLYTYKLKHININNHE